MKIINRELVLPEDYKPPLELRSTDYRKKPNQAKPITINLTEINIIRLHYSIRNKKKQVFYDKFIRDRLDPRLLIIGYQIPRNP
jgi:hypothetical protein